MLSKLRERYPDGNSAFMYDESLYHMAKCVFEMCVAYGVKVPPWLRGSAGLKFGRKRVVLKARECRRTLGTAPRWSGPSNAKIYTIRRSMKQSTPIMNLAAFSLY